MPETFAALIVILFLAAVVFAFASQPASELMRHADFIRRRNLWFAISLTLFLVQNVWVYVLVTGLLLLLTRVRESNPVALFFLLLFAVPVFQAQIPGMGLINFLFSLSHQRMLSLVVLLPVFLTLVRQEKTLPFGRMWPDKLLIIYIVLISVLYLRETSITNTFRQGFYQFTDIFLPYYVLSRYLKNTRSFHEVLLCFVVAVMVLALIGLFEVVRHWPLYSSIQSIYGGNPSYYQRAGLLRANATVGTIPLGYVITVAMGFFLYLQNSVRSRFSRRSGMMLLVGGLLASLSRGPWVGAFFLYLVFIMTGENPFRKMFRFGLAVLVVLSLVAVLPLKVNLIDLLPYFGTTEQGSISYRERLTENALIVIERNPVFGSVNYLETAEMEALRQGEGIIDIVNTYILITLESGLVGLGLFVGFFFTIARGIYRNFRRIQDKQSEEYLLGRSLFATLAAILLIIFTVSSVSIIPIVYWSVSGLGVAYINMTNMSARDRIESQ